MNQTPLSSNNPPSKSGNTSNRPSQIVGVLASLVVVVIIGTFGNAVPFWLDVMRVDILIVICFSAITASSSSRGKYIGAIPLFLGTLVQASFAYSLQPANCAGAGSDFGLSLVFLSAVAARFPIILLVTLLLAVFTVRRFLWRASPLVRALIVAILLLTVGVGARVISSHLGIANPRCANL